MPRPAAAITLSSEEEQTLRHWVQAHKTERRMVERARIVLLAADGAATSAIAQQLNTAPSRVSKWCLRFAEQRLAGLLDRPRAGKPARYDEATRKRILTMLDQPPPEGHATWTGTLLAAALGDVSNHQVWRVLKRQGISLRRRRSWCISTDPEFARKAAAVVGLYLDPPENAVVLAVDEKPSIQALERAQGWLRLPNGKALTGFSHGYKRHGTTTLFAALQVATGWITADHYQRRRRREFLDFMNQLTDRYDGYEIHVILDNLNTHKPRHDRWLQRHKNVHFPTRRLIALGSIRSRYGSAFSVAGRCKAPASHRPGRCATRSTNSSRPTTATPRRSSGPRPPSPLGAYLILIITYASKC